MVNSEFVLCLLKKNGIKSQLKQALIIQGGGFRTAFSAGVLDAFIKNNHNPFDIITSVSGGAIAASYYIAQQEKHCFDSICFLSKNDRFVNYSRFLRYGPLMDVDIFKDISTIHFPFDFNKAHENLKDKKFVIIMTNKNSGEPFYCDPTQTNWTEAVIASCSLPFITKGKHQLDNNLYMDGAWSDPLPIKWIVEQGAKEITIVRTAPSNEKISKSLLDRFGEIYYLKNKKLKEAFTKNHEKYNEAIDFINDPPKGITIKQIAPEKNLKAGLYTKSLDLLMEDYENGLGLGNDFLNNFTR